MCCTDLRLSKKCFIYIINIGKIGQQTKFISEHAYRCDADQRLKSHHFSQYYIFKLNVNICFPLFFEVRNVGIAGNSDKNFKLKID